MEGTERAYPARACVHVQAYAYVHLSVEYSVCVMYGPPPGKHLLELCLDALAVNLILFLLALELLGSQLLLLLLLLLERLPTSTTAHNPHPAECHPVPMTAQPSAMPSQAPRQ